MNFFKSLFVVKTSLLHGCLLFFTFFSLDAQDAKIIDQSHYSNVLGEIRNYRVFLPQGYEKNSEKRYPVIYYYHGWSQRYFGSIRDFQADEGESNGGDNIANFAAQHDVIIIKADGFNRRPNEEYYLRPYNVSPVETYRQFPLYFPELVNHIDNKYRTIADRNHRAISGLSMGGFMTFWISGKYPHLVSCAGNFCGSTEFVVGPYDFPVEYRHQDMYKNYGGVNLRLNYGDKDFIRAYHQDMNKIWTQVIDNYEYKVYDAGHSTAGLSEMFEFLMKSFENPPAKPAKWNHIDVYPAFTVWDYQVNSDRNIPGFTILENVDRRGFKCSVRTFLPDGELMPSVKLSVTTPPIYNKDQFYQIYDLNPLTEELEINSIKSDNKGQLRIELDGGIQEIGINKIDDDPNLTVASYQIENHNWVTHNKKMDLSVRLLNKGVKAGNNVRAKLEATRKSVDILQAESVFDKIESGKIKQSSSTFSFRIKENEVEIERFKLTIYDEKGNEWTDFIDVPIMIDEPLIKDFIIADGKTFEVAAAGDDTVSVFLGKGNGDGKANPGESIVILAKDEGQNYRTLLHSSDPYVNPGGIHLRESDNWSSYDHVGGSAKYSIPVISSDSPEGHLIRFFAEYWLPDYPDHIIKRGVVEIQVEGTDTTSPELEWVKVLGDNIICAKFYDGGPIISANAKLTLKENPEQSFDIELYDNGEEGDLNNSDRVFSRKIEERGFGLYQIQVEAKDIFGNKMIKEHPEIIILH
ncbi:hypothetical protein D1164_22930 [Mariniphaga sediminis]|uniref:Esterase n=1 Tax=Mariniphaga sediminis TaxID=1628158 RepID=A0A399CT75_9BACT|nr:alpha/beta hydrolase-fold protein [Mariniphaga sediminis]RIH62817.1 hypothetical protein D1164_22930 [Mariniphaga sediminis]